jgi:hypothetical protein
MMNLQIVITRRWREPTDKQRGDQRAAMSLAVRSTSTAEQNGALVPVHVDGLEC